ncbi:MAG TPA: ABC transporter substrate-binding protein [Burkholderiales bacterium]|jgi:branched-chain amino acid transport system substrate-binding protein
MLKRLRNIRSIVAVSIVLAAPLAHSQKNYDPGVSDTEIRLGQTTPYSGPLSAYGTFGRAGVAYFNKINAEGGVNGRKLTLLTVDDGFSPPKTVEQTRKLIERDEVFFMFAPVGTATNLAVQKYLNAKKVPQLFLQSGIPHWNDPVNFPYSMSGLPNYGTEVKAFTKYILANKPDARVAILYQNDDFGKEYLKGLKENLGAAAEKTVVGVASFELTDPTVTSQVISLQASGANVFLIAATQKQTAQALRQAYDMGWRPLTLIAFPAVSIGRTFIPAGIEASKGIIASSVFVDPSDPARRDDPDYRAYAAFMDKYYPEGDKFDGLNVAAFVEGQLVVEVLRRCGNTLTRENVMKQASNLKGVKAAMLMHGVTVNTSPTSYNMFKVVQPVTFNGKFMAPIGGLVGD